jgi:lipopolysaccharide heptosyltransferase I
MTRLLVVRLGSLGDLIHTLPAVAAIRAAHPGLEIDWLVDRVHADLLALVPGLSRVVTLGERSAKGWLAARRELRARSYDVALDFQGLIKSAILARLSGARRVVGFDRASLREPAAAFCYSDTVAAAESGHVIHKNLRLAAAMGARADRLEFPIRHVDSPVLQALRDRGLTAFAVMNPGAAWPNKCWPPPMFGEVAGHLADRHGLPSLVLWGPGEQSRADAVAAAAGGSAVVAPPTTLVDLVAIMRGASIVVSGDTGPLHIAAAAGAPVVAIFGPTDPARNGPWAPADVSLSRYDRCACHYERQCRRDEAGWCLGTIAVSDVKDAIDRRLAARSPRPAGGS